MHSWRAGGLVFGSSAAVLMLEIVAGRLMAPYVGVSLQTFTGIIGTVLAGIALGAAAGGSLADRHDPRVLIPWALGLGGVLTWASLPIITLLGPAMGSGPVAIVVLTAAAFLAPATVLSAIGPFVTKLRLGSLDETGSVVGGLSAAGTAGALAGTFLTGFVLVAALPSRPVVLLIGAVLILAGAATTWHLRRRGPSLRGATAIALVGLSALAFSPPCDVETSYFCVRIRDDPDRAAGRSLYLDQMRHAYADLDDPSYLDIRYVRLLASVAETFPDGPIDVLHIGGGGFTLPRYLMDQRPGSEQVVLEIDPALPGIARRELGLRDDDTVDIRIGDARLQLDDLPDGRFDLIIGDAFASTSVPWHLTTSQVMEQLDRLLAPGGIYAMNVIDGGQNRYARAQIATLAAQFDHVAVVLAPRTAASDGPANQILVASNSPLPELAMDRADGRVITGVEVDAYVDGAEVLTDDHAPVDQLMAR